MAVPSKPRRRMLLYLILIASVLAIVFGLYHLRSKPEFELGGNADSPPLLVLFNPFRDRAPERATDTWMKATHRADVHNGIVGDSDICGAPNATIKGWGLKGRRDDRGKAFLSYKLSCSNGDRFLFVELDNSPGAWHVIDWRSYQLWNDFGRIGQVFAIERLSFNPTEAQPMQRASQG